MGTPSNMSSQVEFPKVPLIDLTLIKGMERGPQTTSNAKLKLLKNRKFPGDNNAGVDDPRKYKL